VDAYLNALHAPCTLGINIDFFNSASDKSLMILLEMFEHAHNQGKVIQVCWYYDEDNDALRECAEDMKYNLTLPFSIEAYIDYCGLGVFANE
jgi:SiaC family regulatory phosphoprotein